jgi:hypothetical protein
MKVVGLTGGIASGKCHRCFPFGQLFLLDKKETE